MQWPLCKMNEGEIVLSKFVQGSLREKHKGMMKNVLRASLGEIVIDYECDELSLISVCPLPEV